MSEQQQIRLLKIAIVIGISLLLLGHYFLEYANFPEKYGVMGMVVSATCIAFGLIFSLPTKLYLTFLLVKRENEKKALAKAQQEQNQSDSQEDSASTNPKS